MATAIPGNTRAAESLAYISDASDALAVQEASQGLLAYKVLEALKAKVISAGSLLQNISNANDLLNRLRLHILNSYAEVNPQKIKEANGDAQVLRTLFMQDGPKLASSLDDAQSFLDALSQAGFSIDAPAFFPVLVTKFDENGQEISSTFSYVTESERQALDAFSSVDSGDAAVQIREDIIPPANEGGATSTVRYTCYDGNANLRPRQEDLDSATAFVANDLNQLINTFSAVLAATAKSQDKLEEFVSASAEVNKEQAVRIREAQSQRQQQLIDLLQKFRLLKIERKLQVDSLANRINATPEIDSDTQLPRLIKNSSDRVESVSASEVATEGLVSPKATEVSERKEASSPLKKLADPILPSVSNDPLQQLKGEV